MKKKIYAVLTVWLALFALLPGAAWAEQMPENWQELDAVQAKYLLNGIADCSIERNIIFICYGASNTTVESAIKPWATNSSGGFLIYAYNHGVNDIEDELNVLFDDGMTVEKAELPIVVTYNKRTQKHTVDDYVINPVDVPGVSTGLKTIMSANGVTTSEIVNFQPDNPDNPDKPDNPDDPGVSEPGNLVYPTMGVSEFEWEVLRLVNQYRMGGGVAPLSVFAELAKVSDIRAQELAVSRSHTRPNGGSYETVFSGAGAEVPIERWTTHAENIAAGQNSPDDVMYSWLHSPGHKANIERANKLHLGVGYYYDENGSEFKHLWAQNFLADNRLCSYYDMKLSVYSITGRAGVELEDLLKSENIEVTVTCNAHGLCSLPLIAGMCSVQGGGDYNPNATADQVLQVEYLGAKNTLTVKAYNSEPGGEETPAEKVRLTLNSDQGNIAASGQSVMHVDLSKGQAYKLPLASKSGFSLQYWSDGKNSYKANTDYVVEHDTELIAIWQKNSGGSSGSSGGSSGRRPSNTSKPSQPEKPEEPAKPTKPTEPTKPGSSDNAAAVAEVAAKFSDVQQGDWYAEAVAFVYKQGMMNGMQEDRFMPNEKMTRAMLVTMLYRLEGGKDSDAAAEFADVPSGQWYSDAVSWAASSGVVNGVADGIFAPNDDINREQLAVILYRYAQLKGYDVSATADLDAFTDVRPSDWAREPMQWAVGSGLINGMGENILAPQGNASRAQVAMMLMRFCNNILDK